MVHFIGLYRFDLKIPVFLGQFFCSHFYSLRHSRGVGNLLKRTGEVRQFPPSREGQAVREITNCVGMIDWMRRAGIVLKRLYVFQKYC